MSFASVGIIDRPESFEDMVESIAGFPQAPFSKPNGYAATLQVHLEKLSANASSITHVLKTLCSGLDRLEDKIDTNSFQMEARLANIVHHMTGEADEDTMSAWGSLGSGSPGEPAPSVVRQRGYFGTQAMPLSHEPLRELDEIGVEDQAHMAGEGRRESTEPAVLAVVAAAKAVTEGFAKGDSAQNNEVEDSMTLELGESMPGKAEGLPIANVEKPTLPELEGSIEERIGERKEQKEVKQLAAGKSSEVGLEKSSTEQEMGAQSEAFAEGDIGKSIKIENEHVLGDDLESGVGQLEIETLMKGNIEAISEGKSSPKRHSGLEHGELATKCAPRKRRTEIKDNPRLGDSGPNQNDRVEHRSEESTMPENVVTTREHPSVDAPRLGYDSRVQELCVPDELKLHANGGISSQDVRAVGELQSLETSATLSALDARDLARRRWAWAFGRVCQLIRRRKRKQFEIMTQRATDRTVRLGSRLSIVEKHLDDTHNVLAGMEHLRSKSTAQGQEIKSLTLKLAELSALVGVEDRLKGLLEIAQDHMESVVRSRDLGVEAKMKDGQDELKQQLEDGMKRHGARMEDMGDQYMESSDAVRRAEDRINDMQEEVNTVNQSMIELERQLVVDRRRLNGLEGMKETQQRRLSEIRVQLERNPGNTVVLEPEPEESAEERMSRLLEVAATALEFLSADLDKTVARAEVGIAPEGGDGGHIERDDQSMIDILDHLKGISSDAAVFALQCQRQDTWSVHDEVGGAAWGPVKHAEALCSSIQVVLSGHIGGFRHTSDITATGLSVRSDQLRSSVSVSNLQCPNGRYDLPARLETARDALVPILSEETSMGAIKVELLGLKSDLEYALSGLINPAGDEPEKAAEETSNYMWQDVQIRLSDLDTTLSNIKQALRERGIDLDNSNGAGGICGLDYGELEEQLCSKADVSWVQRELQRLWEALDSRSTDFMASSTLTSPPDGELSAGSLSSLISASPDKQAQTRNPETAGEESDSSPPTTPSIRIFPPVGSTNSSTDPDLGAAEQQTGLPGEHRRHSSITEGSPLIKDLLRKTSRLDQQMMAKADNEEVTRALSSIGTKLRKISAVLPAVEDALSNKIEKKDLSKLAALIAGSDEPGSAGANDENMSNDPTAVVASRLNAKFRCLSCDRPLPAIGPPGPPKPGPGGLSITGSNATPPSPQWKSRIPTTIGFAGQTASRSTSPAASTSRSDAGGFTGAPRGGGSRVTTPGAEDALPESSSAGQTRSCMGSSGTKEPVTSRRRLSAGGKNRTQREAVGRAAAEQPPRLDPIAINAPGELIAGVMSRYPRMMPPPSRIRTAAGGGGAGIGTRPGSSGTGVGIRF